MSEEIKDRIWFYRYLLGSEGGYFRYYRDFVRPMGGGILGRELAMMILDLFNIDYRSHKKKYVDKLCEGHWFRCTRKKLKNSLDWDRKSQTKYLALLRDKGLIQIKMMNHTSKYKRERYIIIDYDNLANLIEPYINSTHRPQVGAVPPTPGRGRHIKDKQNIKNTRESSPAPQSRNPKENPMFINEDKYVNKKTTKRTTPSKNDKRRANQLKKKISDLYGATIEWSLLSWSQVFRKMRKVDKWDSVNIDKILKWYISHADKHFRIKLRNAKEFRSQFGWLTDIYERWEKQNPNITISKETKEVVHNLLKLEWPKETKKQLQVAVETTMDQVVDLFDMLSNSSSPLASMLISRMVDPVSFTQTWFEDVHKSIRNWKDRKGNVISFAWDGDVGNDRLRTLLLNGLDFDSKRQAKGLLRSL